MAPVRPSPLYREWLGEAVTASGLSKREIARRMAARHPRGVSPDTVETARRTINKILAGDLTPTQATRDWIDGALQRDDSPTVEDEEDEEPDLADMLQALARAQAELSRQLSRAMKQGSVA